AEGKVVLLLGGAALGPDALDAVSRVTAATGAEALTVTFPPRLTRGAGVPAVDRLQYLAEFAQMQLAGARALVLVDAPRPASFFAYPDKPSDLVPEGCAVFELADGGDDVVGALEALADRVAPGVAPVPVPAARPERPRGGALTGETAAAAIGAWLPEGAVVVDESNTSGLWLAGATAGAPRHDWLTLTGGAIGIGLPLAVGAAVGAPDRPVVCLESDGSAMYTIQALWTMARENLDVTVVVFDNSSYAVLNLELRRVGATEPGPKASAMLDLHDPTLDFVALAQGLGVPARRAETVDDLTAALDEAAGEDGPHLVQAVVPPAL
ncbi:MAG: acetolactate synthase large subunit, partial [Actinomyces sp.]